MSHKIAIVLILTLGTSGCSENQHDPNSTAGAQAKKQADDLFSLPDPSATWLKANIGPWECAAPEKNPDETLICSKGKRVIFFD